MTTVTRIVTTDRGPTLLKDGQRVKTKKGDVVQVTARQAKAFAHQLKDPNVVKAEAEAIAAQAQAAADLAKAQAAKAGGATKGAGDGKPADAGDGKPK